MLNKQYRQKEHVIKRDLKHYFRSGIHKYKYMLFFLILVILLSISPATALVVNRTILIYPISDASISEQFPNNNFGSNALWVDGTVGVRYESFLNFSLSSIPVNAVSIVSSNLYINKQGGYQTITLYDVDSAWTENGITWNTAPTIGSSFKTANTVPNWNIIDVQSEVSSWYLGTNPNFGFSIFGNTTLSTYLSRETVSPFLNITYNISNNVSSVPSILSPINLSLLYTNLINVTWNQSIDIDGDPLTYHWQMSEDSGFTTNLTQSNTSSNYTGLQSILTGKTYYVRIRSYDSFEFSIWSQVIQFTGKSVPSQPFMTFPTNNSIEYINTSISLNWSVSTDADGDSINYTWQISSTNDFSTITVQDNTTNLYSGSQSISANTQYFLRVRANDNHSNSSVWSPTVSQRDIVTVVPVNNSDDSYTYPPMAKNIWFNFTAYNSTASQFNLVIATDSTFGNVIYSATNSNLNNSVSLSNNSYWWRVRTYYGGSTYGVWTPVQRFNLSAVYSGGDGSTGVQGTVYYVYSSTTYPIEGAKVFIYNASWSSTMYTGITGYYSFPQLANESVYYISVTASNYVPSDIHIVNTTAGVWTTRNIPLLKCTSTLECTYNSVYNTFFVYKASTGQFYPGVTVKVYEYGAVEPFKTLTTSTYDGSATVFLIKDTYYTITFTGTGSDFKSITIYPSASANTQCYGSGVCFSVVLGSVAKHFNNLSWTLSHTNTTIFFNVSDPSSELDDNVTIVIGNTTNASLYAGAYTGSPINLSYTPDNYTAYTQYFVTYILYTTSYGNIISTQWIDLRTGYESRILSLSTMNEAQKVFIMICILFTGLMIGSRTNGAIVSMIGGFATIAWNFASGLAMSWNYWVIFLIIISILIRSKRR